jgi:hypothetical protein
MVPHLAIINVANYLLDVTLESNLYLLPSRLDPLEVWAERDEFFEDNDSKNSWKAWAVAHSDSMSLDLGDIITAIQQLSSFIKWLKGLNLYPPTLQDQILARKQNDPRWSEKLDEQITAAVERKAREDAGWRSSVSVMDRYQLDQLDKKVEGLLKKSVTQKLLKALEKGPIKQKFGPYKWGPIFLGSDTTFVKARIANSCARIGGESHQPYEAAEAGKCLLVIETSRRRFGGESAWGNKDLLVKAIEVEVLPQGLRIPAGSNTAFEATVRNAKDKKVQWRAEGVGSPFGENLYRWKAPDELDDGRCRQDFTIEAESMARTGPRATGEPPRVGQAIVTVEEPSQLAIVPEEAVLAPGETYEFGYRADGSSEVRWSAEAPGKIDGRSGEYTAPLKGGAYVVRAALEGADGGSCAEDEALVRVAECSWTVIVDGKTFVSKEGDEASFASMPGGFGITLMQNDGGAVGVSRTPEGDGVGGGTMGVSPVEQYGSYSNDRNPKPPMALTLDRQDGGVVAGRASGTVRVFNFPAEEARLAPFNAEFTIVGDPDASSGSPMDDLGNLGQMLDKMPMLPPGAISEEQQKQLEEALRSAMSAEEAARERVEMKDLKDLQDAQAMMGGFKTLNCKVK